MDGALSNLLRIWINKGAEENEENITHLIEVRQGEKWSKTEEKNLNQESTKERKFY